MNSSSVLENSVGYDDDFEEGEESFSPKKFEEPIKKIVNYLESDNFEYVSDIVQPEIHVNEHKSYVGLKPEIIQNFPSRDHLRKEDSAMYSIGKLDDYLYSDRQSLTPQENYQHDNDSLNVRQKSNSLDSGDYDQEAVSKKLSMSAAEYHAYNKIAQNVAIAYSHNSSQSDHLLANTYSNSHQSPYPNSQFASVSDNLNQNSTFSNDSGSLTSGYFDKPVVFPPKSTNNSHNNSNKAIELIEKLDLSGIKPPEISTNNSIGNSEADSQQDNNNGENVEYSFDQNNESQYEGEYEDGGDTEYDHADYENDHMQSDHPLSDEQQYQQQYQQPEQYTAGESDYHESEHNQEEYQQNEQDQHQHYQEPEYCNQEEPSDEWGDDASEQPVPDFPLLNSDHDNDHVVEPPPPMQHKIRLSIIAVTADTKLGNNDSDDKLVNNYKNISNNIDNIGLTKNNYESKEGDKIEGNSSSKSQLNNIVIDAIAIDNSLEYSQNYEENYTPIYTVEENHTPIDTNTNISEERFSPTNSHILTPYVKNSSIDGTDHVEPSFSFPDGTEDVHSAVSKLTAQMFVSDAITRGSFSAANSPNKQTQQLASTASATHKSNEFPEYENDFVASPSTDLPVPNTAAESAPLDTTRSKAESLNGEETDLLHFLEQQTSAVTTDTFNNTPTKTITNINNTAAVFDNLIANAASTTNNNVMLANTNADTDTDKHDSKHDVTGAVVTHESSVVEYGDDFAEVDNDILMGENTNNTSDNISTSNNNNQNSNNSGDIGNDDVHSAVSKLAAQIFVSDAITRGSFSAANSPNKQTQQKHSLADNTNIRSSTSISDKNDVKLSSSFVAGLINTAVTNRSSFLQLSPTKIIEPNSGLSINTITAESVLSNVYAKVKTPSPKKKQPDGIHGSTDNLYGEDFDTTEPMKTPAKEPTVPDNRSQLSERELSEIVVLSSIATATKSFLATKTDQNQHDSNSNDTNSNNNNNNHDDINSNHSNNNQQNEHSTDIEPLTEHSTSIIELLHKPPAVPKFSLDLLQQYDPSMSRGAKNNKNMNNSSSNKPVSAYHNEAYYKNKANAIRKLANNNNNNSNSNSSIRPVSAAASLPSGSKKASQLRNTVENNRQQNNKNSNTFITAVPNNDSNMLRSKSATQVRSPINKHPKNTIKQTEIAPIYHPSQHMNKKISHTLFKSAMQTDVPLSKFCAHRKPYASCPELVCHETSEKFKWLNLFRYKAKLAYDLIMQCDAQWREKLELSLQESIDELKEQHEVEIEQLKRKFRKPTTNQRILNDNLKYFKAVEGNLNSYIYEDQEAVYKSSGLTVDHYDYVKKHVDHITEANYLARKKAVDVKRFDQAKQIDKLKMSISGPMKYLDRIRDNQIEILSQAVMRVDQSFQHSIRLAGESVSKQPIVTYEGSVAYTGHGTGGTSGNNGGVGLHAESQYNTVNHSANKYNAIFNAQLKRSSQQSYAILKLSFSAIIKVCKDLRKMYGGQMKFDEAKKHEILYNHDNNTDTSGANMTEYNNYSTGTPVDNEHSNVDNNTKLSNGQSNVSSNSKKLRPVSAAPSSLKQKSTASNTTDNKSEHTRTTTHSKQNSTNSSGKMRPTTAPSHSSINSKHSHNSKHSQNTSSMNNSKHSNVDGIASEHSPQQHNASYYSDFEDGNDDNGDAAEGEQQGEDLLYEDDFIQREGSHVSAEIESILESSQQLENQVNSILEEYSNASRQHTYSVDNHSIPDEIEDGNTAIGSGTGTGVAERGRRISYTERNISPYSNTEFLQYDSDQFPILDTTVNNANNDNNNTNSENNAENNENNDTKKKKKVSKHAKIMSLVHKETLHLDKMKDTKLNTKLALRDILLQSPKKKPKPMNLNSTRPDFMPNNSGVLYSLDGFENPDHNYASNNTNSNTMNANNVQYQTYYSSDNTNNRSHAHSNDYSTGGFDTTDQPDPIHTDNYTTTQNIGNGRGTGHSEVKNIEWNPVLCCYCHQRFKGEGKSLPSTTVPDKKVRVRVATTRLSEEPSLYDYNTKVKINPHTAQQERDSYLTELLSQKIAADYQKQCCSWVCLKRYATACCPVQYKYERGMLVDLAAGYIVDG